MVVVRVRVSVTLWFGLVRCYVLGLICVWGQDWGLG